MIVLSIILGGCLAHGMSGQRVPLWGHFETSVVDSRSYANPFTDVTLAAAFIRPDARDWVLHLNREE